ncbi:phenylacetate-CoA ligase [Mucilaginibacter frigoritolerans]|uniref:Phenylacetate-CoA ligase n=1 Tax=Mucilaginibacter frigoritolerans TaxID=652788 RepID=A0A562TQS1_9SPHI|nr:AMP-binding protein [Mucilaginibacter frigoritolerans]TWI95951.1 phenylacetate-CoA ligase [Mucilaginibacter frigoritolerans]
MNDQHLSDYYAIARASSLFNSFYADYPDYYDAPILDKKVLIKLLDAHFDLQNEARGVYLVRSGGSTQKPLVFPVDIEENLEQRKVLARALTNDHIFSPNTIALNMFGYMDMYRTAAILDDILEKCQATTLAVSANVKYEDAYDTALHFKPNFIFGTPSKLFLFAQHLKKNGQKLLIKNLLFAGEFLLPSYIQVFKEYLGTTNIYSIYGSAETGIWAWSDYSNNPSLFKVIDGLLTEIINPDADGYGNILVTNLFRKRFPVFRYSLGDVGRLITINGINYLELKTREKGSFTLYESNYSLDDFKDVLEDADNFQIQLLTNSDLHVEVKFMLLKDLPEPEIKQFEVAKLKQVQDVLGYKLRHLHVLAGKELDFYTDRVTCKTPLIADFRR